MALTTTEQNKIVQLLGYGGKILQAGSVIYNQVLNDRLTNLPTDTESVARAYLGTITTIETQMTAAVTRMSTEKVGDLTLNKREMEDLRRERKRVAREISSLLDIPYVAGGGVNVSVVV